MFAYRIDDMTCGHCASAISKAVRAVDAGAMVEVDLAQHLVRIQPTQAGSHELSEAITDAGYTPVPFELQEVAIAPAPHAGGCCGSGAPSRGS